MKDTNNDTPGIATFKAAFQDIPQPPDAHEPATNRAGNHGPPPLPPPPDEERINRVLGRQQTVASVGQEAVEAAPPPLPAPPARDRMQRAARQRALATPPDLSAPLPPLREVDISGRHQAIPIGSGENGQVIRLDGPSGTQPLAFKTIKGSASKEKDAALLSEGQLWQAVSGDGQGLGRHPNIAKCLGVAEVNGTKGLVIEHIEGTDMASAMSAMEVAYKAGEMKHEEYFGVLQYAMSQVLCAIEYLDKLGVVHNDVRDSNIMFDAKTGDVKLIDFGVAVNRKQNPAQEPSIGASLNDEGLPYKNKVSDHARPEPATLMAPIGFGTVAPEFYVAADQGDADPRQVLSGKHDVFSVGATTYKRVEGEDFTYNDEGIVKYGKTVLPEEVPGIALSIDRPASAPGEKNDRGRIPGFADVATDYTNFVNRAMHPDPAKRLSPGTARDANFLSDPLLTDEQARRVLIRFLNPNRPVNPDQDDEEPLDRKGRGSGSADANHSGNGAALSSDPTSGGQPDQADPAALGGKPGSLPSEAADEDFRLEQAKAKAEAERQHFMEIEAVARAQADGSLGGQGQGLRLKERKLSLRCIGQRSVRCVATERH